MTRSPLALSLQRRPATPMPFPRTGLPCAPDHRKYRATLHATAAMNAEHGIVRIHAQTMLPATPQRTADRFWIEPTPTIAPVMVCVVDTGIPSAVARKSVIAPPVSAQKPLTGFSLVMR